MVKLHSISHCRSHGLSMLLYLYNFLGEVSTHTSSSLIRFKEAFLLAQKYGTLADILLANDDYFVIHSSRH
jgi:hypothetical protein